MPGINDKIASAMLSAQVGALREGSKLFSALSEDLVLAEDAIWERIGRQTGHAARGARAIARKTGLEMGRTIESRLEEFAQRRVAMLHEKLSKLAGVELREPRGELSLRFLRGDVEKFMGQAAENAATRASEFIARGETPDQGLKLLAHHTKTVARSGVNAAHNAAVLAIARANKSIVQGVMAMATLDNRTSELCIGRHGGAWSLETNEPLPFSSVSEPFPGRPPWHFNCRTTLVPVFFGEDVPEIQNQEMDAWFESDDAREALGGDRVDQYDDGVITREQLLAVTGEQEAAPVTPAAHAPYLSKLKRELEEELDKFRNEETLPGMKVYGLTGKQYADRFRLRNNLDIGGEGISGEGVWQHGNSPEPLRQMDDAVAKLPADLRSKLGAIEVGLVSTNDIVKLGKDVNWRLPTHDIVGVYVPESKALAVSSQASAKMGYPDAVFHVLVHEMGHAMDMSVSDPAMPSFRGLSSSRAFTAAVKLDFEEQWEVRLQVLPTLNASQRHWVNYANSNDMETFAELFGSVIGSGHIDSVVASTYEKLYPRTLSLMREMYSRWLKTPVVKGK